PSARPGGFVRSSSGDHKGYLFRTTASTRRLRCLFAAVSFGATGFDSPAPLVAIRAAGRLSRATSHAFTDSARRLERSRLCASEPSLSVWPVSVTAPEYARITVA